MTGDIANDIKVTVHPASCRAGKSSDHVKFLKVNNSVL